MYVNVLYLQMWYVHERSVLAGEVCTLTFCNFRRGMYVNVLYLQMWYVHERSVLTGVGLYVNPLHLQVWYVRELTLLSGVVCTLKYCTCRCCICS